MGWSVGRNSTDPLHVISCKWGLLWGNSSTEGGLRQGALMLYGVRSERDREVWFLKVQYSNPAGFSLVACKEFWQQEVLNVLSVKDG